MSTPPGPTTEKLTFRRFKDGDAKWDSWRDQIFQASWTHKCPTYIQSTPPCQGSCPSGEDIRGYLNIVRGIEKPPAGVSWQEYAWRRLTEANPFPSVMGRVCPAPCETGCNRNEVEDHVGINSVEHFLGEYAIANKLAYAAPPAKTGKKVAVIGGGPAGLSCAYQLVKKGHEVAIFDEHEYLGGMMRYGIPGFRTPREVLDAEIQRIVDLGVTVHTKCRVGTDVTLESLRSDFDAVFLGMGAQSGRPLPAPGGDAPNVVTATAFLKAFNDGRLRHVGKRVVVIGGGDTSIDVATVARRLGHIGHAKPTDFPELAIAGHLAHDVAEVSVKQGAEVVLTSVFNVDKMQANKHEIEQAQAEGIAIRGGLAPVKVVKDANGRAIALTRRPLRGEIHRPEARDQGDRGHRGRHSCGLGRLGDRPGGRFHRARGIRQRQGRGRHRQELPDSRQAGHLRRRRRHPAAPAHHGDRSRRDRRRRDRPLSSRRGPGEAAQGRCPCVRSHRKMVEKGLAFKETHEPIRGTDGANVGIHNYDNRSDRYVIPHEELFLGHFGYTPRHRRAVTTLTRESALGNFEERLAPLAEAEAVAEAKRCMSCGQCFECDNCVVYCPQTAVARVPKKEATMGRYVYTDYDKCIGCHICKDVCPTGYIQMGLGE